MRDGSWRPAARATSRLRAIPTRRGSCGPCRASTGRWQSWQSSSGIPHGATEHRRDARPSAVAGPDGERRGRRPRPRQAGWQLEIPMSNPAANPAEGYESYMVPVLFAPWAANLIQAADPRPGESVLDVGCGTGIVARQIVSRLRGRAAVTGIDLNPNMLAVARAAGAREEVAVKWREGRAEALPFPDATFDLTLCQFA